jgi:hypothetical protein
MNNERNTNRDTQTRDYVTVGVICAIAYAIAGPIGLGLVGVWAILHW